MRNKIIGVSVIVAFLAILCAQSVAAQPELPSVYAWTDKPQYKPGETGKLMISVLNDEDVPVKINSVYIEYPWFVYNAKTGEWEGNETVTEGLPKWINPGEVYYTEVEFKIPTDGRVAQEGRIDVDVKTEDGTAEPKRDPALLISSVSWPMTVTGLDAWMTSLTLTVVVCTIVLAIVVLLATRRIRAPRALIPRAAAPPPPPKPKAKAE